MGAKKRIWTDADRAMVRRMARIGIPQDTIAKCMEPPTTVETLERYFKTELREASTKANAAIAGALFKNAMEGNVAAQIFWCKTRLKWRETAELDLNGGNLIFNVNLDPANDGSSGTKS